MPEHGIANELMLERQVDVQFVYEVDGEVKKKDLVSILPHHDVLLLPVDLDCCLVLGQLVRRDDLSRIAGRKAELSAGFRYVEELVFQEENVGDLLLGCEGVVDACESADYPRPEAHYRQEGHPHGVF